MSDPSLARKLANLTPEQLQRLRQQLATSGASVTPGLPPREIDQVTPDQGIEINGLPLWPATSTQLVISSLPSAQKRPLSFAQQRLWFLDQLDSEQSTYNIVSAWRLLGKLDIETLTQSLNHLLQRHELLHCQLGLDNGEPYWIPDRQTSLELVIDVIPETEIQAKINVLAAEPFNLYAGLLWRVKLLRISRHNHILIIIFHHMINDGLSMQLFSQELSQVYREILNKVVITLPDLPINYSDFSHWQKQWIEGEIAQKSLAYWKSHLANSPPLLELPTDYERPAIQSNRGKQISLQLSTALVRDLQQLSQSHGVTLFMTMLATFKLLLARLSGCSDIILGTPVAGRNRLELEPLFGFFVNTVVLRTELGENLTVKTLLQRIQSTVISAYEHQEIPFEKLVEEIHPQRSQSYHPIFQVWFNFLANDELTPLHFPHVITEVIPSDETPAKFDLTLYVRKNDQGLQLRLVYNADLFGDRRAEAMLNQYEFLLQQIVAHPDYAIDDFSLVTPSAALVLPDPTSPLPLIPQPSIPDFISHHSSKFADRLAVVDDQKQWTYQALENTSNDLAQALLQSGLQPQEIVAIYGDRRGELIGAILGILKAGGAFLLLDPDYPEQRLLDCLQGAGAVGLIDLKGIPPTFTAMREFTVNNAYKFNLELFADDGHFSQNHSPNSHLPKSPLPSVNPDHLAYLLFTSGSTGKPKGIKVNHHPLVHFLTWYQREFDVNEGDKFSLLGGLSHDIILRDIFAPLCLGATLYIPQQSARQDSQKLVHWLNQHQVTVTHLTPPLAELISIAACQLPSLRYCFFGGDQLTQKIIATTAQFAPTATLVNFYGTTETPQAIAYEMLPSPPPPHGLNPSLGKGIDDAQLLILTEKQHLAGIGEWGEIYVRTPYLSLGYLGDDPATQGAFIANPFTGLATDRLYKTGDLGRYLPDGRVDFGGRRDQQVKIRGFRIELGEIEAVLGQHPGIKQAIAMVREDDQGFKQLVAYGIVNQSEAMDGLPNWREYLKTRLPDYMIPTQFIELDQIPLTPNGKIDKSSLPQPGLILSHSEKTSVAPRTALEAKLLNIWQNHLTANVMGIHDNFFELGGHSLLAVKLVAEIEKNCGVKLPLSELFFNPTIAQLGQYLDAQTLAVETEPIPCGLIPIKIQRGTAPLFAIHTLGVGAKHFRSLSDSLAKSVIGVNAQYESTLSFSFRTIDWFAERYCHDLMAYQKEGSYSLIGYSIGGLCAFEVALRLIKAGKQVEHLILIDTFFPGVQKIADVDQSNDHQLSQQWLRKQYYQAINELRYLKYVGKPFSAVPESLQHYVSLRENRKAHRHHQIQMSYPGDLIYIRSTSSRPLHAETWQRWVKGQFICHEVSGLHNELLASNRVPAIADILNTYL